MSNSDIYVAFGADTGGLEAALAVTKANVTALQREMTTLAREMQKTGAAADSDLGQRLSSLGGKIAETKAKAKELSEILSGGSEGGGGGHGGHGTIFGLQSGVFLELRALLDEALAGRMRNFEGSFARLSGMIGPAVAGFATANPLITAMGAAAVTAAAGLGYFAYQGISASNAMRNLQLDAAVDGWRLAVDVSGTLRDSIEKLAGVSASTAEEIAKPFLAMGPVGEIIAQEMAPRLKDFAKEMGEDVPKAAETLAKRFSEFQTVGLQFINTARAATEEEKEQYRAFAASGNAIGAARIMYDVTTRSVKSLAEEQKLSSAASVDAAWASQRAADGIRTLDSAEGHLKTATSEAKEQIVTETAALSSLDAALQRATDAAGTFQRGMTEALKIDKVGTDIDETKGRIKGLEDALAAAPEGSTAAIAKLNRALDDERDRLKGLQEQAATGPGGGDLVSSMKEQLEQTDATWKGSEQARLQAHLDAINKMLAGDQITEAQRRQLTTESLQAEKQVRDAANESYLRNQQIQIAAAGKNSAEKISILEAEVKRETDVYGEGSKQQEAALDRLARAKEEAANRGVRASSSAAKDELAASVAGFQGQIKAAEDASKSKIEIANDEFKLKQISEAQKVAAITAALAEEAAAVKAAFDKEIALAGQKQAKIIELQNQERHELASIVDQQVKDQVDAARQTEAAWQADGSQILSAWNSQLRGLLAGTESFSSAVKKMSADLAIKLIEDGEKSALQWAIGEALKTQAVLTGTATRTAAETSAAGVGAAAQAPSVLASIMASAGEAFAGVFAFFAPVLGPGAAGPAAGAYGTVAAMAGSVASADIGMWDVPRDQLALVHHNELIMPATEAGALRSMLSGGVGSGGGNVSVNPTTHLHVNALDGASVGNWMRNNAGDMAKHIHAAARQGALLGMRRLPT